MPEDLSAQVARSHEMIARRFDEELAEQVTSALRILLESKHLYQSERVDFTQAIGGGPPNIENRLWDLGSKVLAPLPGTLLPRQASAQTAPLIVSPPIVKSYCRSCDRTEPFHVSTRQEIGSALFISRGSREQVPLQNFALSYTCQSCRGAPEAFLIRREGLRLTLCGRSPIEHIDVPKVVPKVARSYYSSAVVAFQSGQALAANFLLRVLIEQWVLSVIPKDSAKETLLDAYVDTLPEDFRSRFPTLRDMYSNLSADIHGAIGSAKLFHSSQKDLVRHFEARRLYEL